MAVKEYTVRASSIVANLDKDGRRKQRHDQGKTVKLDDSFNNVEYLESIGAIGTGDDVGPISTRELIRRNNAYHGKGPVRHVDTGLQAAEPSGAIDDGGAGSDPAPGVEGSNPGDPEPEPLSTTRKK